MGELKAKSRDALAKSKFAWPEKRKFPIENAGHVTAALARLAHEIKVGRISSEEGAKIHSRIAKAGKGFGVDVKKMDLAPTSVHAPGMMKVKKRISVRANLGPGGSLHVRHHMTASGVKEAVLMLDAYAIKQGDKVLPSTVGVTLNGPSKWSDGEYVTLVWVQLAEAGAWKGHAAGPFALTAQTFADMKANFDKRGIPVMFDLNHVSESDPTEGSLPMIERSKAYGWIHRMDNRGTLGLWGLVEWLDETRTAIQKGELKYVSPAIRMQSKDQVTGDAAGARLTSCAVTNNPFLSRMPGLIAASDAVTHTHSHEFMPHIRACLKCDAMASPTECSDALEKLRNYHALGDGKPVQGVDVPGMMGDMRDRLRVPLTTGDDELFEQVQSMIDSAIAEHEEKFHASGLDGSPKLDDDGDEGGGDDTTEMSMKTAEQQLAEAKIELETVKLELTASATALKSARDEVVSLTARVEAGDAAVVRLAAVETAQIGSDVDQVMADYSVAADQRPHLLEFRSKSPASFLGMYPKRTPKARALATNLTGGNARGPADTVTLTDSADSDLITVKLNEEPQLVVDRILKKRPHLSYGQAQVEAQKLLSAAERAHERLLTGEG